MSVYLINKILYLTDNDADFRKRIKEDPEAARVSGFGGLKPD